MRRAARVDSSQASIVAALRRAGALVLPLHAVGHGVPDLLVYRPATATWVFVEVKTPRGTLTLEQVAFRAAGWPVAICRTPEDALRAIGAI